VHKEVLMADVMVSRSSLNGFEVVTAQNRALALTMLPDLGGKITSIRDLRSGREWLWSNPALPYRRLAYGASYLREADTGGWDECFPTVAACPYPSHPWQGTPLPDHGELWPQPWRLDIVQDTNGGVRLATVSQGVAFPYTFERTVHVWLRVEF